MKRATGRWMAAGLLGLMGWVWLGAWAYCPHEAASAAAHSAMPHAESAAHAHDGAAASDGGDAPARPPAGPDCPLASGSPAGCTMTVQLTPVGAVVPLVETHAAVVWPRVVLHSSNVRSPIFRPPIG